MTFTGYLADHDDVLAEMRGADVFVSPSTREGFGIAAVEAMAADCTVVAVEHPQSAAAAVVDDAGILVGPEVAALADGLSRALAGADLSRDPIGRAAEFDWEPLTDEVGAAYRHAIDGTW